MLNGSFLVRIVPYHCKDFSKIPLQVEQTLRANVSELKSDNIRYEAELNIRNTDLESTKQQLEAALS